MTPLTVNDCNKYIAMIRIEYPHAFQIQARDEKERADLYTMLCASWYRQLEQYPKELCDRAVMDALGNAREGRYPRIGDVKYQAEKLLSAFEKNSEELWAELTVALNKVRRANYYGNTEWYDNGRLINPAEETKRIYDGLSAELQAYVGDLPEMVSLSRQETLEYEKGRFLKTIPTIKERAKVRRETSEKLAGIIQGLSGQVALDCDGTKLLKGD